MQTLFLASAFGGASFFLFKRRPFDYFALAFFSAVIYFMPGFLDTTTFYLAGEWLDSSIHPEAYAVMTTVLLSLVMAAMLADYLPKRTLRVGFKGQNIAIWILAAAVLVGFGGTIAAGGPEIFSSVKDDFGETLGRWHILFYTSAIMGFAVAFVQKRYFFAVLFFLMLSFDMFLQFRLAFSIAMISVLMLLLNDGRPVDRLVKRWRLLLSIAAIGFLLFASKHLIFVMKANEWELVTERLTSPEWYGLVLMRSEPFATLHLLNEVVTRRFETGWDHIYTVVYQLLLFSPEIGGTTVTFNEYLQKDLFPDADYGLASNIWAQMWSAGGWPLLLVFLLAFNAFLFAGNVALRMQSAFLRPALVPLFVYWAFYIHRNDLNYIVNLEKRVVLVAVFTIVLAELVFTSLRLAPFRTRTIESKAKQS